MTAHEEPGRSDGPQRDLLGLDAAALGALVDELGERPYRSRQIFGWLHKRLASSIDEMTDLPKAFRARLAEVCAIRGPVVDDVRVAADGTRKYSLRTHDGHFIEAVWIPHASGPGKNALCISSQAGCAMGCTFCATAAMKLARHLTPGEIVGQLYAVVRDLSSARATGATAAAAADGFDDDLRDEDVADEGAGEQEERERRFVQNIVYMGMGEPLHNVDGVIASVALLTHQDGQGMSPRRLTVSTSGLVPGMSRLGKETDVHLAVSLNATTDDVRAQVMPVNARFDIAALLDACRSFPLKPRRRITFEYVLLADVNDSDDDAHRLIELLRGMKTKVNLIPYNPHPLSPFKRPSDGRVERFRAILDGGHLSCFVRTTRGLDIDAACGMLGAKKLEEARRTGNSSLPVVG